MTNWFAEIEMRRFWRDRIPEEEMSRRLYPTEPKPQLAEWWDETDYNPEWGRLLDEDPPRGVEITDRRVVVPLSTTRELVRNNVSVADWVYENILPGMPVNETENGKVLVGGQGNYGKVRTMETEGLRGKVQRKETTETARLDTEPDPRPVYVQLPPNHPLVKLRQMWAERRSQDRDMKVIVTARDSATGTGKTTLAVALSKYFDGNGWSADKATLSPQEYVDKYTELEPGSVLLGDEAEQMADPRRAMTEQNVTLTQYWATMRQWRVSTIVTLPSPTMIDKRLKELMDVRIVVRERGLAVAYEKKVDDHSGNVKEKRMHRIRWDPLDDDRDYRRLNQMKKERMENFQERAYYMSDGDAERKDPDVAVREYRDQRIRHAVDELGKSQKEVAKLFDLSRPRISQIVARDEV
jgi:predicted XRE-type DNA-binding protein